MHKHIYIYICEYARQRKTIRTWAMPDDQRLSRDYRGPLKWFTHQGALKLAICQHTPRKKSKCMMLLYADLCSALPAMTEMRRTPSIREHPVLHQGVLKPEVCQHTQRPTSECIIIFLGALCSVFVRMTEICRTRSVRQDYLFKNGTPSDKEMLPNKLTTGVCVK